MKSKKQKPAKLLLRRVLTLSMALMMTISMLPAEIFAVDIFDLADITFKGTVTLAPVDLAEGQFQFELYDEGGDLLETVSNDADGNYQFSKLTFGPEDVEEVAIGTFVPTTKKYKVKEKNLGAAGYSYDTREYDIQLTLTCEVSSLGGPGNFKEYYIHIATNIDVEALDFANTYAAEGTLTLGGLKKLSAGNVKPQEGQFTFTLTDETDSDNVKEIATGTNDGDGNILFDPGTITYKYDAEHNDLGEHTYVIRETGEAGNGAAADAEKVTVKVTVTDNGNGTLSVSPKDITSDVTMVNTYETTGGITFGGKKTLKGRDLEEGEFAFELYDEEGELVESVKNDAGGSYRFSELTFTGADLATGEDGTYVETTRKYKVVEKAGDDANVTYDDTEYKITLTLADDGLGNIKVSSDTDVESLDFANVYTPDDPDEAVDTGDDTDTCLPVAAALASAILLAGIGFGRRRRRL